MERKDGQKVIRTTIKFNLYDFHINFFQFINIPLYICLDCVFIICLDCVIIICLVFIKETIWFYSSHKNSEYFNFPVVLLDHS